MEFDFDAIEEEDSPFPEVRASVSNIDDPEMPCLTFRMWVIGLVLRMIGSGFFNFPPLAPQVIRPYPYSSRTPSKTRDVFAAYNDILIVNTYSLASTTWWTRLEGD